jgi:hypothetical protein
MDTDLTFLLDLMKDWNPRDPESLREGIISIAKIFPQFHWFLFVPQECAFIFREYINILVETFGKDKILTQEEKESLQTMANSTVIYVTEHCIMDSEDLEKFGISKDKIDKQFLAQVTERVDKVFEGCEDLRKSTYHGDGGGTRCAIL